MDFFYESFKLKIFIFCIRVTKFYTFSWNRSYRNNTNMPILAGMKKKTIKSKNGTVLTEVIKLLQSNKAKQRDA